MTRVARTPLPPQAYTAPRCGMVHFLMAPAA